MSAIKAHPYRAISIAVLTLGGGMTLLFLVSIRHMPDLDLAGSSGLLAAVAVVGACIVVAMGCFGLAPSFMGAVTFEELVESPGKRALHLALCSLPAGTMVFVLLLQSAPRKAFVSDVIYAAGPEQILLYAVLASLLVSIFPIEKKKLSQQFFVTAFKYVTHVLLCWVWILVAAMIVMFSLALYVKESDSDLSLYFAIAVWILALLCINSWVVFWRTGASAIEGVVLAIAFLPLVLVVEGNLSGIPRAAFRALGYADMPVRLVVTAEGCELINAAVRGGPVCVDETEAGKKYAVVCPVILKSRLGSPYLIEFSPMADDGKWPALKGRQSIPIAKEFVLSWPLIQPRTGPKLGSDESIGALSKMLGLHMSSNKHERLWVESVCR